MIFVCNCKFYPRISASIHNKSVLYSMPEEEKVLPSTYLFYCKLFRLLVCSLGSSSFICMFSCLEHVQRQNWKPLIALCNWILKGQLKQNITFAVQLLNFKDFVMLNPLGELNVTKLNKCGLSKWKCLKIFIKSYDSIYNYEIRLNFNIYFPLFKDRMNYY